MSAKTPVPNSTNTSQLKRRGGSRKWMLAAEVLLLFGVLAWVAVSLLGKDGRPEGSASLKVQLRDSHETVYVLHDEAGKYTFRVSRLTGPPMDLSPDQFAVRVFQDQQARGIFSRLLNVTSPWGFIWVATGLLGQVLFTGRMIVQWLASEKSKRSVVPPAFWWMSLIGATMLLVYFIWRKDAVGVLGQSVGWFIYVRNLWLIYEGHKPEQVDAAPNVPVEAEAIEQTIATAVKGN